VRLIIAIILIGIITTSILTILWWQDVINLPPVAVRNIGRVASAISTNPSLTVELPTVFHNKNTLCHAK